MVPEPDKYQSREIRRVIRDILLEEWDPLGVRGTSGAERVYDAFVGSVYLLLKMPDITVDQVGAHLIDAAVERLAFERTEIAPASARAAAKLMELRPQLQLH